MARRFTEKELLIASGNKGKVAELAELLAPYHITLHSTATFNLPEPEETESSFIGNAILKANYYGKATGLPALADDSGLSVDALNGAPGVYSARWAGPDKDFYTAMQRVEQELHLQESTTNPLNYNAHFTCALALRWPDGHIEKVEGIIEGTLTFPPKGTRGFGYDPIFMPNGYDITFGQMDPDHKNTISHRAKAFQQLIESCFR